MPLFNAGFNNTPGPATDAFTITPSDSVNFVSGGARALYVGTTGNISVQCFSGAVTFLNVPVGWFPVSCIRINATGTTASNLIGLI